MKILSGLRSRWTMARAAGVVEADDRRTVAEREIHHLADLLSEGFGERPAEHGEILREHVHETPVDSAVSGNDAVPVRLQPVEAEIGRAMRHEPIELDEGAFIEQHVEPFTRGELSLVVLRLDARTATALLGLGAPLLEQGELVFHGHRSEKLTRQRAISHQPSAQTTESKTADRLSTLRRSS